MKQAKQNLKGLPNYFKVIGGVSLLISISLMFLLKFIGVDKDISLKIVFSLIIISGLLFILAKEKIEDERIERVKLISFSSAFLFVVGYSVSGMWLIESFNIFSLAFSGILVYIFVFYSQKRKL